MAAGLVCCVNDTFLCLSFGSAKRVCSVSAYRAAFADEQGLEQMVHMLDGMKGINLIMTYGGGTYDLHQFIPHQVLFVLLCASAGLGLLYAQGGCIRRAS
jgi:hypothetical protein